MIDDSMKEIVNDFVQEALELLDSLNENFIELEKQPENKEILNTIFRAAHTIKGSAGFLGFQNIVELAHSAENILNKLRQGEIIITAEMTDDLLKTMDILRNMIVAVSETGTEGEPPAGNAELITRLNDFAEGKIPSDSARPQPEQDEKTGAEIIDVIPEGILSADETAAASEEASAVLPEERPAKETEASQESLPLPAQPDAESSDAHAKKKKARSLGDILLEDNLISKEELEQIYKEKEEEEKKRTGAAPHETPKSKAPVEAENKTAPAAAPSEPVSPKVQTVKAPQPAPKAAQPAVPTAAAPLEIKETTIRVDIDRLDNVMNLVGELVLARNRMFNIASKLEIKYAEDDLSSSMAQVAANLNLVTTDLQLAVMKTRMQPVKKVFSKFPRMVRDLSRELGKDIDLQVFGEETELDKSVIEEIGDPLVHLIRNSVDHGVEDKETRRKNGKSEKGIIKLSAEHEGNYIIISVEDDGKGIDSAVIKRKAVEKGVIDEKTAASLSDKDALSLIFAPGFSTKDKATEISGRGVGMDVVKTNIQKLNGIIDIDTTPGHGSLITLKLPLTVAIIQTLIVGVGDEVFAIPLNSVVETLRIKESTIQTIDKHEVINLRKSVLSLLRLGYEFEIPRKSVQPSDDAPAEPADREIYVVVVALAEKKIGIAVDDLFGQEEVVIKSLGDYRLGYKGISGATITGDGRVVLIIDVASLIESVKTR